MKVTENEADELSAKVLARLLEQRKTEEPNAIEAFKKLMSSGDILSGKPQETSIDPNKTSKEKSLG